MKTAMDNNEIDRLVNLYEFNILDTEFDDRFDNLVAMMSAHFCAPIALVSLVDVDRQWFKAMTGFDQRQTPRHHSFCAHAIMPPHEVMVVEDARADPRFHDNPLVGGSPHIRFYAGAPILTDNGAALGTVCVLDCEPRGFDAADKQMLARFASIARSLLDLHRRNEMLRPTRDHLLRVADETPSIARHAGRAQAQDNAGNESAGDNAANATVPVAPHGEPPMIDSPMPISLPPADTTRWVPGRKADVVAAVLGGVISIEEVFRRYNLTLEEFTGWQRAVERGGHKGLRTTEMQSYRDISKGAAQPSDTMGLPNEPAPENSRGNDHRNGTVPGIDTERRSASRMALLLRVAKLVIDGREQFCVIRDASTTGLKVKLFVAMPPHATLAVELANGESYRVECIWHEGDNAGLRFCEPIPLASLLDYARDAGRRRHLRLRLTLDGLLHLGETTTPITIHDISQQGAAIKTEKWLLVNELVKLETALLPTIYARVRWRNHPHYGIIFEQTFQLEDLAVRVSAPERHRGRNADDQSKVG